ncbi:MAG: glycerate kinase [Tetrasphaera sp.]
MRVLVAPDKYKGCLTAAEVADAIGRGLISAGVEPVLLPLADGGDGSVAAAVAAGFTEVPVTVTGADGRPNAAAIALDGQRAVVEVASTCGIAGLAGNLQPMAASSHGFGEAVVAAIEHGATDILLALGGSASTDGGTGLLTALGARLLDADGNPLAAGGAALGALESIDTSGLVDLGNVLMTVATDVDNPLLGELGAARVFGPQKGASPEQVAELERGLAHLVGILDAAGIAAQQGCGAAGGLGFACAWLGATRVQGADHFLDLLGFDQAVAGCNAVITGEGASDEQTLHGKLPARVAARSAGRPVHLVVGLSNLSAAQAKQLGAASVTALVDLTDGDPYADPALSERLLESAGATLGRALADGKA